MIIVHHHSQCLLSRQLNPRNSHSLLPRQLNPSNSHSLLPRNSHSLLPRQLNPSNSHSLLLRQLNPSNSLLRNVQGPSGIAAQSQQPYTTVGQLSSISSVSSVSPLPSPVGHFVSGISVSPVKPKAPHEGVESLTLEIEV